MKIEPPRRTPDNEQKLIVLECLAQLGPCTEMQLLQFLAEQDQMNYFDMMFALTDLCDRGQTARVRHATGFQYGITDAGREALQLFGSRVPVSLKEELTETASEWKSRFREEMQNQQKITQTDRGDYELCLKVMERDADMMRLTLSLPTRDAADHLAKNWPQKSVKIYDTVIRILSEDEP